MKTVTLAFLALAAFAQPAPPPSRAVLNTPVANMHSKPTADSDVVSQARYAITVDILRQEGAWARVRTPGDNYEGWVELSLLRPLKPGESYPSGRALAIESNYAHLYREPSVTKHRPVLTLPFETRLEVLAERPEENNRWLAVKLVDGSQAFIQRGDINPAPAVRPIPELIQLSKRFLGLPYTWGGTSSYGYDCSGFAQMLVRQGGVDMPRDAQPQADWEKMRPVDRAALIPGDLLYFGSSAKKITHTGFYLGNGEFIHATTNTHPILQISRLDDEPWTKLFVAARRWKY